MKKTLFTEKFTMARNEGLSSSLLSLIKEIRSTGKDALADQSQEVLQQLTRFTNTQIKERLGTFHD